MAEVFLTRHAIQRYRERVADVPAADIWRALDCPAVRIAIDFGARFVRLSGGQRVVIRDEKIVTVLPTNFRLQALARHYDTYDLDGEPHAQG